MKKITIKIDNNNLNSIDVALREANEYLNNPNKDKVYHNLTIIEDIEIGKNVSFEDFCGLFIKKHNLIKK